MWLIQAGISEKFIDSPCSRKKNECLLCYRQEVSSVVYYERQERIFIIMYKSMFSCHLIHMVLQRVGK